MDFLAVDDIEQGQGVDEEISLLPDAEREISEADKERAILAMEAAEKEVENDVADVAEDNEDENGKDSICTQCYFSYNFLTASIHCR